MIRPASRRSRTAAGSSAGAPRASSATSRSSSRRRRWRARSASATPAGRPTGGPNEAQRPSARDREARRRPQRHHREFPRAARTSSAPRTCRFETETDTEVVAQLVTSEIAKGTSPMEAVAATLPRLRGAFALAFLFAGDEDQLIGARHGAAARDRPRRGRDVSRLRRHRARALHRRGHLSRGRRLGRAVARKGVQIRDARRRRSSGRASAFRPAPSWPTRATTAISWRRRSTSSPRSSAARSPTTSTSRPGRSCCRTRCRSTSRR